MNSFLRSTMDSYYADLNQKMEVYSVVREMVDDIEMWDVENALLKTQKNLLSTQQLNDAVIAKMRRLVDKNTKLEQELLKIKNVAFDTRENFVKDIGLFLSENKQVKKMKDRIAELEAKLEHVATYGTLEPVEDPEPEIDAAPTTSDSAATEQSAEHADSERSGAAPAASASAVVTVKEQEMFLYDLDDEFLLHIFSYFDEGSEVLNVAHSCRHFFSRVNALFEIPNPLVQPEWSLRPRRHALPATSVATTAAPSTPERGTKTASSALTPDKARALDTAQAGNKGVPVPAPAPGVAISVAPPAAPVPQDPVLTKEIIDVLIKKLTPAELMVIMSIAERLKKQTSQVHALSAEKEDISAKLENTESVRNFLIEKLKAAEMEIKSLMANASSLRKQSASDQEIIGYLDLRVNELETHRAELAGRCQQLQASLDLQVGAHTQKEHQLSAELSDCKLKYEKLDLNMKAQKKVLIKEVKTLRSQLEGITAERNLQLTQFRLLKEALNMAK